MKGHCVLPNEGILPRGTAEVDRLRFPVNVSRSPENLIISFFQLEERVCREDDIPTPRA